MDPERIELSSKQGINKLSTGLEDTWLSAQARRIFIPNLSVDADIASVSIIAETICYFIMQRSDR